MSSGLIHSILASVKRRGVRDSIQVGWYRASAQFGIGSRKASHDPAIARFDKRFGVETSAIVGGSQLGVAGENSRFGSKYQPTPMWLIQHVLSRLPIRHEEFTFVDLGSGKGLVLLVAAEWPFRRILGVEYSAEMHEIAQQNLQNYRNPKQRCFDIESICTDVTEYELPDGPLVLYLFNSFRGEVLRKFLSVLQTSIERNPREIYLAYCRPAEAGLVEEHPWLRLVDCGEQARIYHYPPETS